MTRSLLRTALVVAPMLVVAGPARGQAGGIPIELPDSVVGRRAGAFVAAYNSNDDDRIRAFEKTHRAPSTRSIAERGAAIRRLRSDSGPLVLERVLDVAAESMSLLTFAETSEEWTRLDFTFVADDVRRLRSVAFTSSAVRALVDVRSADWTTLRSLVDPLREAVGAPALAAAVVREGGVVERAVCGVRRSDAADPVRLDDRFHIGSLGKAFTATVIGALVEHGELRWETTLAEALPGVGMRPEYHDVTIEQVLRHRAGLQTYHAADDLRRLLAFDGTATEQRARLAATVLSAPPVAPPGEAMRYSNAGYGIAGYIAEVTTGRSWATLLETHLSAPLGLTSVGIGWPATAECREQPFGHVREGATLRPEEPGTHPLAPAIVPAGHLHCSIDDLARFAALHLEGLRGRDGAVTADTIERLHRLPETGARYAAGWSIHPMRDGTLEHAHAGWRQLARTIVDQCVARHGGERRQQR
ncbi:MAG: serine hydrolase domain-containing protein [Planctomycetota bacterium]|jgi:CubicO group peptidase (beta-lactamase class C family)